MGIAVIALSAVLSGLMSPKSVVQTGTEKLRAELRRSNAKPAEIMKAVESFVDMAELSKRSLGDAWKDRTEKERTEFVDVMREILRASYEDTARHQLQGDMAFTKEEVGADDATVYATVKDKSEDIPVVYKLHKASAGWRVYDLVVDEASLLDQYRSTFKRQMATKGFGGLLTQLKAKKTEIEKRGKLSGDPPAGDKD